MELTLWCEWEESSGVEENQQPEWNLFFQKVVEEALREEKIECPVEVELNVVNDEVIREMNREYRAIDRSTDVLSFPMCSFTPEHAFEEILEEEKDPQSGKVALGNIVLSWEHVQAQAQEYGHSIQREAAFLVAHSMMHLLGYDHMVPEEEKQMFGKQETVLQNLGITRETK